MVNKWRDLSDEVKIETIRKKTKEILDRDGKLAFEKYHDAKSLKKLKELIKGGIN